MRSMYRAEYIYIEKELKELEGMFFDKAYFHGTMYRIKFNKKSLTFMPGIRANITTTIPPEIIQNKFVQKLRKELRGKKLLGICCKQKDRVIELDFGEKKLILEMFGKGNAVLVEGVVVDAIKMTKRVLKGTPYTYPNLIPLEFSELRKHFKNKVLGAMLSSVLGKPYNKYITKALGIDEKMDVSKLSRNTFNEIMEYFYEHATPYTFWNSEVKDFGLFPFLSNAKKEETLSKAVDLFYANIKEENPELIRLRKSIEKLKDTIKEYKSKAEEYKQIGDYIYEHYTELEEILEQAKKNPQELEKKGIKIDKKNKTVELEL